MKSCFCFVTTFAWYCIFTAVPVAAEETRLISPSQSINLTIYNNGLGLVKDLRRLELKEGLNSVRFEDVAARIDPTSVSFQSLTAPNTVVVREQNYQYDLLSPETILAKSIGKQLKFKRFLPSGGVEELSGTLISAAPTPATSDLAATPYNNGRLSAPYTYTGLVLKTPDAIVLNPVGQVELGELPAGLISKPSLLWKLESNRAGNHNVEIAYQTTGMNWHCDYVALVNKDDSRTDLTSWVTLDNQSGASYKSARLKLIAGDVHRVTAPMPQMMGRSVAMAMEASAPQFKETSFAEYHLYALQNTTDVNDNEMKQLSLFNAGDIPTKKMYVFESESAYYYVPPSNDNSKKVKVKLEFDNSNANNLGMPMPKGKVRVYKRDNDGSLQFIGEDNIDHTPKDENVRIYIGDAFDVVGERTQTNAQRLDNSRQRLSYEITLRNHKDEDISVTDVEHSNGSWKIISSTIPFNKKDSHTFEFPVSVPANGQAVVDYTIEVRY